MSKAAELAALIGSGQAQIASNLIINGGMRIAQRGTSATNSGYGTVDRTKPEFSGVSVTQTQEALTSGGPYDDGHRYFLRCANTSTSSATSAYLQINQEIEAQNVATSGWKFTSSTSFVTMSFWARSSLAGTYNVLLKSHDGTAQGFTSAFTLVADTWKKIEVTVPGNSNITVNTDNGYGLRCYVVPHFGTDYTTSGHTSDAWQTLSGSNLAPDYAQNWSNTASATFDLTGWKVEVGQVSTPYPHEDIGTTLLKCQRYYFRWTADSTYDAAVSGFCINHQQAFGVYNMPVRMRNAPTMGVGGNWNIFTNGEQAATDFSLNRSQHDTVMTYMTASSGMTAGSGCLMRTNNDDDAYFEFIAEL